MKEICLVQNDCFLLSSSLSYFCLCFVYYQIGPQWGGIGGQWEEKPLWC